MWERNHCNEEDLKAANWFLAEMVICRNQPKAAVMQKFNELMDAGHRELLKDNVMRKLKGDYGYTEKYACCTAGHMIDGLPKELFYNVEEWLDDKEISELAYNGLSIKQIMECHKNSGKVYNFIRCTKLMVDYVHGCSKHDIINSLCIQ